MFHLRYTPYDISGYTFKFLEKYESFIIAQEDVDDNGTPLLHYHVLVDTDYDIQSLRNDAKAALKIPPVGRGKNNKYYALIDDWKDPGYICKYNNIIGHKGFSEKEVMDYVISGKNKYLDKVKTTELSGAVAPAVVSIKPKKTMSTERLVSTDILAWYYELEAKGEEPSKRQVIDQACSLYRKYDKGISIFKIRDIVHTLYYDVNSTRDSIIEKIYSIC